MILRKHTDVRDTITDAVLLVNDYDSGVSYALPFPEGAEPALTLRNALAALAVDGIDPEACIWEVLCISTLEIKTMVKVGGAFGYAPLIDTVFYYRTGQLLPFNHIEEIIAGKRGLEPCHWTFQRGSDCTRTSSCESGKCVGRVGGFSSDASSPTDTDTGTGTGPGTPTSDTTAG